ncbi:MAG TPA: TIGR00374 family protein, partial [Streptomyces sp.]|nr:TIGR00374 family protein [Streptomyces sp.]
MKQQGAHPEDPEGRGGPEGNPDASSRPRGADAPAPPPGTDRGDGTAPGAGDGPGRAAAAGRPCADEAHIDEVEGDEPLLPARVHRPSDLMRLLVGVLAVAILIGIAAFAHGTTSGLEQDINKGTGQAPDVFSKIAGLVSSIAILLVPVAFAIERLIKR